MKFYNKLSPLYKRSVWAKSMGFIFSLIGFIYISFLDKDNQFCLIKWGILLWYPTLGGIIGLMGVIKKIPIFNIKFSYWRGAFIGAYMNFLLMLIALEPLKEMIDTISGYVLSNGLFFTYFMIEGAIFGFVVDYIVTKKFGEGKDLLK